MVGSGMLAIMVACATSATDGPVTDDAAAGADAAAESDAPRGPTMECGDTSGVREPSRLPSGACAPKSACSLLVWHPCSCHKEHAAIDGYDCTCADGVWHCTRTAVGATICQLSAECKASTFDAAKD